MNPKASIILTSHNYAKYLPKAIESALAQVHDSFEVVVVNDGSVDDTKQVLENYKDDPKVKIVTLGGVGLASAANYGIEASRGEYIVRLDADDWFDEHLLMVLSRYLDRHKDVGLVFCDYHTVDAFGEFIQTIRRAKVNDEVELLDRPCLAAGAMFRRKCFDVIGGYNPSLRYQEDYDFWIKFIEKFQVRNVSLPLMFYRQHGSNMSRNWNGRMKVRQVVKKKFVEENRQHSKQKILAVIPARSDRLNGDKFPLLPFKDKTLLEHCIDTVNQVACVERIIVSTEDPEIAECAEKAGAEIPMLRSMASISPSVTFAIALEELVRWLKVNENYQPEYICVVYPHSPFITPDHIAEALDTLLLYKTDSVVAVVEDLTNHWKIGSKGLSAVGGYQNRVVRQDKDIVFKETGSIYMIKTKNLVGADEMLGQTIGHIELSPSQAFRIYGKWEYDVTKMIAVD